MPLTVVCLSLQGMISLVLQCVDRLHIYSSAAHFAEVAGREAGESWKSILNSLYELLGKKDGWALAVVWVRAFYWSHQFSPELHYVP